MKTYNIWYCHPYAGFPSRGKKFPNRPYYLGKAWCAAGCSVTVVTSSFTHLTGLQVSNPDPFALGEDGVLRYAWLKTRVYAGNQVGRILNMLSYARQLRKHGKALAKKVGRPDVIIASAQHPFHFFACKKLAKHFGARLVVEVRDIWPMSLVELLGLSPWHPLCLVLSYIEKAMCKKCDAFVSVLGGAKDYFLGRGLSESKFYIVPNGYALGEVVSDDKSLMQDPEYLKLLELKNSGHFLIGYTGAHGEANYLSILCEAVTTISDNVALVLIGDGELKSSLQAQYGGHSNIYFFARKPVAKIKAFQELIDLAYTAVKPLPLYQYGVSPNKLYEYMYNRRLLLTGSYPESSPAIAANCAVLFENNSLDSLVDTIKTARNLTSEEVKVLTDRGHDYVVKHNLYDHLAKQYLEVFDEISKKSTP